MWQRSFTRDGDKTRSTNEDRAEGQMVTGTGLGPDRSGHTPGKRVTRVTFGVFLRNSRKKGLQKGLHVTLKSYKGAQASIALRAQRVTGTGFGPVSLAPPEKRLQSYICGFLREFAKIKVTKRLQ